MSNNIGFVHSSNEQQGLSISSLAAVYEQLLHVNSYNEDGGRGGRGGEEWLCGYAKIIRKGYEGRKECDSRPMPCGCESLQNVRVAALVKRPANVESPSDFYLVIVQVLAINQTFRCSHRQTNLSLSPPLSLSLQCVIIFAGNDQ